MNVLLHNTLNIGYTRAKQHNYGECAPAQHIQTLIALVQDTILRAKSIALLRNRTHGHACILKCIPKYA